MNAKPKTKWLRSPEYLAWVRTLPSVVSGQTGCVAHHLAGYGNRGNTKVHDFWTIPLTGNEHNLGVGSLHSGVETWEARHGEQWNHVASTLGRAIAVGVLKVLDLGAADMETQDFESNENYCNEVIELIDLGAIVVNKKAALGRENVF